MIQKTVSPDIIPSHCLFQYEELCAKYNLSHKGHTVEAFNFTASCTLYKSQFNYF
jgi:hypothetical protein